MKHVSVHLIIFRSNRPKWESESKPALNLNNQNDLHCILLKQSHFLRIVYLVDGFDYFGYNISFYTLFCLW